LRTAVKELVDLLFGRFVALLFLRFIPWAPKLKEVKTLARASLFVKSG
jgi:hypothetical protein